MQNVSSLHRSLDQELVALLRGASLECLCCGEFVMHARGGSVFCPECSSQLADALPCDDVVVKEPSAWRCRVAAAKLPARAMGFVNGTQQRIRCESRRVTSS